MNPDSPAAPRCAICGSRNAHFLFSAPDVTRSGGPDLFRVGRCLGCRHIYVLNPPSREEIGRFYPEGYHAHPPEDDDVRARSRRHRHIRRPPPFRILDVGSGGGRDLVRFLQSGCEAYAVEPDAKAADEARRRGIRVETATVEAASFPDGHFDVITMFHALEHLHDPLRAMRNLRRMIHPEGELHLLFPTGDALNLRLFRKDWYALMVPQHLQFFTHDSFGRLCRESGFRILRRRCRSGTRILRYTLDLAERRNAWPLRLAGTLRRTRPLRWVLRAAIRYGLDGMRLGDVAEYALRPA